MFVQILTSIVFFLCAKAAPSAVGPTSFVLVGDSTTANGYVDIGAIYESISLESFTGLHQIAEVGVTGSAALPSQEISHPLQRERLASIQPIMELPQEVL